MEGGFVLVDEVFGVMPISSKSVLTVQSNVPRYVGCGASYVLSGIRRTFEREYYFPVNHSDYLFRHRAFLSFHIPAYVERILFQYMDGMEFVF